MPPLADHRSKQTFTLAPIDRSFYNAHPRWKPSARFSSGVSAVDNTKTMTTTKPSATAFGGDVSVLVVVTSRIHKH